MVTLHKILSAYDSAHYASEKGTQTHARLQGIRIDGKNTTGDSELVQIIQKHPELVPFFGSDSKTEVPIAATINKRFISRRIDRLVIDATNKTIKILDYKTDINRTVRHDRYVNQLCEYATVLHAIYPDYKILAYILWTHDFSLENVPVKSL